MFVQDAFQQVSEAYADSVFNKNVGAFVSLYSTDVRVFDMRGVWEFSGVTEWRGMVGNWFASLGDDRVLVEFDQVQQHVTDNLVMVSAVVHYQRVSATGEKLQRMPNRLTWLLKQENGGWQIAHEHTSAPVDMDSGKVMLEH